MKRYFPPRIFFRFATAGPAALAFALLCPSPLHAQSVAVQGAPRGTVIRPVAPPPPIQVTPVRVPGIALHPAFRAPVLHPPVSPGFPPDRFPTPAVRAVQPVLISPAPTDNLVTAGPPPFRLPSPGAPVPPDLFRLPPDSPRLLMHAPRVAPIGLSPLSAKLLAPPIPPLAVASLAANPPSLASQPIVVPHLYCSPDSVMFNTGSICFNPDTETIDPSFYPWGLYAPPPFINKPGFVAEFRPSLLVQLTPQWTNPNAGLFPPESPYDRWRRLTAGGLPFPESQPSFHVAATPTPVSASQAVKPVGPPVALVDVSGATVLVTRYWLGRDWMLHYISVTGQRGTIPIEELNFKATGAANYARGVVFVIPGWPEPQANH